MSQIASEDNQAYPFTKGLSQKVFDQHVEGMGVRCIGAWLESSGRLIGIKTASHALLSLCMA